MNISSGKNPPRNMFKKNISRFSPVMSLKLHCVHDIMPFFSEDIKDISIACICIFLSLQMKAFSDYKLRSVIKISSNKYRTNKFVLTVMLSNFV